MTAAQARITFARQPRCSAIVTPADDMAHEQFVLLCESSTVDGDKLSVYRLAATGDLQELRRYDNSLEGREYARQHLEALRSRRDYLRFMSRFPRRPVAAARIELDLPRASSECLRR